MFSRSQKGGGLAKKNVREITIRWVTWWPIPYWTDRFNELAGRVEVDFEAFFLSVRSKELPDEIQGGAWKFRHTYLRQEEDDTGYYKTRIRFPRPYKLIRGEFDALVMTYADLTCISAALACLIMHKPFYFFVANTLYDARKESAFREFLKKYLLNKAVGILATGPAQRDYALQYMRDSSKLFVIGNPSQNPIELKEIMIASRDLLRANFGWSNKVVLLYVGRLSEEKGLRTLLSSLSIKHNSVLPKLVLAGAGPLEASLRLEAVRLELDVEFLGYVPRGRLTAYYAAADIFVLPSVSEPWGLVVNEAMEFGLPLILSDHVGSAPVLLREGITGFSFPAGHAEALSTCIKHLCEDDVLRRQMGKSSVSLIQEHSISRWVDNVLSAITSMQPERGVG